ncbi:MAG: iron dicitrate transport regulator FecR, partial [Ideonella sp.]|nr:iron dicitrate transport regulator FecR [Ideonella sp.]
ADAEVTALGTAFVVRKTGDEGSVQTSVTLIEGRISVQAAPGASAPVLMSPGDHLRLSPRAGQAPTKAERLPLDRVLAWRRNEAVFEDVSLAEAVAEMNRYSRTPIVLRGNESLSGRRVSGVYKTGDNESFARAVAALHGLTVRVREGRLELSAGT